jgi:transcriptional regulator with XRE-family HTH domain
MDPSFGTKLRQRREQHQIPLATIAEKTKIKMSLLEGLERDDVSRWPKGIFRRSYLRAYASAIGLEPDPTLREFMGLFPEPDDDVEFTQAVAQARQIEGYQNPRKPPTRLRCLIDSAVSALPALHRQTGRAEGRTERTLAPPARDVPVPAAVAREMPPPRELPIVAVAHQIPPTREVPVIAHDTSSTRAGFVDAVVQESSPTKHLPVPADVAHEAPPAIHTEPGVDLMEVAHLCTRLACALDVCDISPVLDEATRVLRAIGLIVWVRNCVGTELSPVFVHGYSSEVTAQLARVSRESDNAIALAFRSGETRIVDGSREATGAVVVPMATPTGCAGVLALELKNAGERLECVRAAATILAAQLSTLLAAPMLDDAVTA